MTLRCTFIALMLFGPRLAAQAPDRWQPIRDSIQSQLVRGPSAAMAVAVAKDGKIIWEQGFGWANREKMIAATAHTTFSLASISKPITATGLMVLLNRRLVDLDRPANDYLGIGKLTGLAGDASQATVRRVLSHTSGLPLHYQFFYSNESLRPVTMDETIARYGNLVSAPGETFQYSNLGFGIIDHIISRVASQTYADFMRSEVFLPLGMTHTSIDIGPGLEPYVAERYDRGDGHPIPFYTFDHNGGSAVYSSAHDLVRFGMFHLKSHLADQRPILPDSLIGQMQQVVATNAFGDSATSYGLGWVVHRNNRGYTVIEHSGGMPGVATVLHLFPSEHLAIVALTNGGGDPNAIAEDIAALMLPPYRERLLADRGTARQAVAPKFTAPSELLGKWSGTLRTWQSNIPARLVVEADGDVKIMLGDSTVQGGPSPMARQDPALLDGAQWDRGVLVGQFAGTIPTPDASRVPHLIEIALRLVGGKLRGQAAAVSSTEPARFALSSYLELTKEP